MHVINQICVLLLVKMQIIYISVFCCPTDCTLQQFLNGPMFDSNFDTTGLQTSYPAGKQIRVGCSVGYSGFFKLTCVEGKWVSKGTVCQPKSCGHPGDAQFADFNLEIGDDFVFGSKVVYTCHKGYQMVSRTNYRHCMNEGWDGVVPVCEAQQCTVLHVDRNVQVNGDPEEATYGNVVRFSCKSNSHVLSDPESAELYCDENGEWSGQAPKCIEIKCTVPPIENGHVPDRYIQEYKEHDVLHFMCNYLHKPTEDRPSKCTKVGIKAEWTPTPACEPIKCKLPLPPLEGSRYESVSRNRFLPGETLRVICGEKYGISNNQEVVTMCKEDGEWTIRPVCTEVVCSNERPQHVYSWDVSYWRNQPKMGETKRYSCETGYKRKDGATQATCTRNGWTPNPLCEGIVKMCDLLYGEEKESYSQNEEVQYECNDREQWFTVTCEQSGWTGIKSCTDACPKPEVPNGFAVGPYNNTIYYTCKKGFKLFSNKGWWAEAKCNDDQLQQCIENTKCGETPVIPNGKLEPPQRQNLRQIQARIICNKGYSTQVDYLPCRGGKWIPDGLSLKDISTAKHCKPPPKVENAVVQTAYQKEYLSNSPVTYQCRDGYDMEGEDTILCDNGKWEEKNVTCTQRPCERLHIEDAVITGEEKESYSQNEEVQYKCNNHDERFTVTCEQSGWTGIKSFRISGIICCCLYCLKLLIKQILSLKTEKCKVPRLSDGLQLPTYEQRDQLRTGEKLTFTCRRRGDFLRGKAEVECLAGGRWSDPFPTCGAPLGCGTPPYLADADTRGALKFQYRHGETVEYICQNYYRKEGETYKTCINGEWIGQMRCLKPCTVDRELMNRYNIAFRYGYSDKLYSPHDDTIEFTCTKGRHTGTLSMRQKCIDGVMNLPTCQ
uniref:Complement factor H n=1 Tax=Sander lucioperca TaxID=283035 RepID=A0A8C9YDB2_SANLU